ncbi:site-2 protease family protein [Chryseolinea sp. T2]|uniref:site-2 protease family protein n=1 Tax=Chryseolinea sp. T2 TaxID=3129255 RepID=UPI003076BBE3
MTRETRTLLIQAVLFIMTVATTTIAGAEWTYGKSVFMPGYGWSDFVSGFSFSIPFLLILTTHELGHYFTARHHSVSASLPYYIPLPPLPFSIGTMGALIRLRQRVYSKKQNFDIGISGPLAGFAMAFAILIYGFINLPEPEYIFEIHPEYEEYGMNYKDHVYNSSSDKIIDVVVGQNLLFLFFEKYVADPERMPNPHELMHYPLLFAGFLSLVFTSINLFPIGQLDGGHVVYGLFGFKVHRIIATIAFIALIYYAGIGLIDTHQPTEDLIQWIAGGVLFLYMTLQGLGLSRRDTLMYAVLILASLLLLGTFFPHAQGAPILILFLFVLGRFIGIQHPPSEIEEPLDTKRIILGWLALIILVICFSPSPLEIGS